MSGQLSTGAGYVQRRIDVSFTLSGATTDIVGMPQQPQTFNGAGNNTVLATGLRVQASIAKAPGSMLHHANLRIYGLTLDIMNKLSTLGKAIPKANPNTVTVKAGDANGTAVVFVGNIDLCYVDAQGMPEVALVVHAFTGIDAAMKPVPPTTWKGSVDVATIMGMLAKLAGYTLENSGVSGVMLTDQYLPGTAREQVDKAAQAADICYTFDGGVLAIWPREGHRSGPVPLISPDTGLVGYPTAYGEGGISVTSIYNPSIVAMGQVQVQSSITTACGTWTVQSLEHQLESETPGGAWFTHMNCWILGHVG
jgi:hypothetical protein